MNNKLLVPLILAGVIGLVALVYWPAHSAGFVWDDTTCLHDAAWMRHGDSWKQNIWSNFCDWSNYFRPLVVAMFVVEVRIFDVAPEPMHLVSLGLHLTNTLLVGLFARMISPEQSTKKTKFLVGAAALLYGLHPALIEPVAWISCQAELVVTMFTLLALIGNYTIRQTAIRALTVAACFLAAAGAKESAAVLPLLLVLFDWIRMDTQAAGTGRSKVNRLLRHQWPVYVCVLAAGIAYLTMRFAFLGFLLQPTDGTPLLSLERWQTVGFVYLTYLRIIVWPMIDLGPTHEVDGTVFATFDVVSAAIDLAALTIFLAGLIATHKRKPAGYAIVAVTIALLPVLRLVPVQFDPSLYHERYAMMATAMVLSLMPRVAHSISLPPTMSRPIAAAAVALGLLWFGMAITNIRVTLPLWSDETKLWLWAARGNPESSFRNNLLLAYIKRNDLTHARAVAASLIIDKQPCPGCMINVANLSMLDHDLEGASTALQRAKQTITAQTPGRVVQTYIFTVGLLLEMQHDLQGANDAFRDAIAMDPLDPQAHFELALVLVSQGKLKEAQGSADLAYSLFPPDTREARRHRFEQARAAAISAQIPSPSQEGQ